MRYILAMLFALSVSLMTAPASANPTVYFDDGSTATVPAGYKILVVPHWVKPMYVRQEVPVRVLNINPTQPEPGAIYCTPAGELSLGAPPCPAPNEPAPPSRSQDCTPAGELSLGAPPCRDDGG